MADAGWLKPTLVLCTYGFFKEMKPSEAFLTPYLKGPDKNISSKALSDEIYPVSTYAYLLFLLLVLLTTDILRYKPLIVIESIAYLTTRVMLIWGNGILVMQLMQVTYGIASATEIAYYSYIYAMVDERYYRKVTSYTRLFVLLGKGIGDSMGQVLISTKVSNYLQLNYVSLVSVSIAVLVSLFLPKVEGSILQVDSVNAFRRFSNSNDAGNDSTLDNEPQYDGESSNDDVIGVQSTVSTGCAAKYSCAGLYFKRLFTMFRTSYGNPRLLKWSVWWALSMCGGLQVEDYAMNLWSNLQQTSNVYNGGVFAMATLISAFFVFLFSLVKVEWGVVSEFVIGIISVVDCVLLLMSAYTKNVWVAYACYIVFRALFGFSLTVASYQIAVEISVSSYGLIFGWNTFIALCFQSLLTLVVVDKRGLDLNESKQFVVYAFYHGLIAVLFLVAWLSAVVLRCLTRRKETINAPVSNRPL